MRLFMIRHGQTTANLEKFYAGQSDVPLTDRGRQEALALQPILAPFSFDRVYSSDLSRALQTQQLALPGVPALQTPALREFDVGSLLGKSYADAFAGLDDVYRRERDYRIFGGEDARAVRRRLEGFLRSLEAEPLETVAVFTHNGILGCMLELVLGACFDTRAVKSGNCSIHVYEFDGSRWKLLAWNYSGKL